MSKVLIVEDETLLSDVYSMVLNLNGFMTEVVGNGLEALEKLKTFEADIILLDLLMPQMDGITFLKTLRHDPTKHPKIIVYSNLLDSRKEEEVKSLGAVEIVLKSSLTPDGLVELVSSQVDTFN
ncbi:MAG: response regulator [Candidatus Saccharimonadales bacterium]